MPVWTKRALQNLDSVLERIAQDDPQTAKQVAQEIQTAASKLDEFPRLGRPGLLDGTRELVFPRLPYVLVYRLGKQVQILRFFAYPPTLAVASSVDHVVELC